MKRLLCLISGMNAGGAESFLMKIYRNIDRSHFQMDFCINVSEKCFYEDEITQLGGRIYRIPSKSVDIKEFKKQLTVIVKNNYYERVLRITSNAMGFMDLKIAKKAGAKVCIVRSSNSSDGGSLKSRIAHSVGRLLYGKYVDVKIAPSELAAAYTFGKKAVRNGEVNILHNGLDLNMFRYDETGRKAIRDEFNIAEDVPVIGHIGRFSRQKNHDFLIDIFSTIKKKAPNAMLLLVGGGELEVMIRDKVDALGLTDSVIFAGIRKDVPQLLSAMDVFVFPSFYEGMPNTVIEAQATGLPCVIADTITREADVTGLVEYLPLEKSVEEWAECVIQKSFQGRMDIHQMMTDYGYDIDAVVNEFTRLVFAE